MTALTIAFAIHIHFLDGTHQVQSFLSWPSFSTTVVAAINVKERKPLGSEYTSVLEKLQSSLCRKTEREKGNYSVQLCGSGVRLMANWNCAFHLVPSRLFLARKELNSCDL